jgi:hypothetical protein
MKIAYITGYWVGKDFIGIYFWQDSSGNWYGDFPIERFENESPTVFPNRDILYKRLEHAKLANEEYKINNRNIFEIYGEPIIVEVDISPLNVANMSEKQYNDYVLYRLQQ